MWSQIIAYGLNINCLLSCIVLIRIHNNSNKYLNFLSKYRYDMKLYLLWNTCTTVKSQILHCCRVCLLVNGYSPQIANLLPNIASGVHWNTGGIFAFNNVQCTSSITFIICSCSSYWSFPIRETQIHIFSSNKQIFQSTSIIININVISAHYIPNIPFSRNRFNDVCMVNKSINKLFKIIYCNL